MIYVLVFLSGLAGLTYEILWMKQLGLLFGSTAHAASATLAAFFAGLAAGSWFWGRRSARAGNALRTYAWLEVAIAVTALLYFAILRFYHHIYPSVYQSIDSDAVLLLIKFALALMLIFPPAFCMGGTIPVIGQYMIRRQSSFGSMSALLYGINTLGAATGATLAGFFLPLWIGFTATCAAAMSITGLIALSAFYLSRNPPAPEEWMPVDEKKAKKKAKKKGGKKKTQQGAQQVGATTTRAVKGLCFLSGFGVLALEVLWTRMFAQVLENSVYTFAAILVVVLICLAAGSLISSRLARLKADPYSVLAVLVVSGGIAVLLTPFVFMRLTDSFQILTSKGSWLAYVGLIFKTGFLTVGPPALILGTLFPFLMKVEEKQAACAGQSLGRLAMFNTVGAIVGATVCGFFFLETLGMWRTMQWISVIYLAAALLIPIDWDGKGFTIKMASVLALLLVFSVLNPTRLPVVSVDQVRHQEKILETWEGSDCTVAATQDKYGISLKINSHYNLGSTGAYMQEKLQADIPLMVYPETEDVFFLGMGTGITAGSALSEQFNVKRTVTCELVPEVVTAAKKYMTDIDGFDCTGGLFSDPRSTIHVEDGRHYLMASGDQFEMINADLFVPYRSGAGSLYSKEHFASVEKSLKPGGVFFQWIPLYQVTENEFSIIAKTMLDVFDQVSLWRNNFQPGDEVFAFVGHKGMEPLPACDTDSSADKIMAIAGKYHYDLQRLALPFDPQTILFFYCGNLTENKELFADYPVNTDDQPVIEYMAPRSYRNKSGASSPWFTGTKIAGLVEELQRRCPPDQDPLLVNRSAANRRLPVAGTHFHRARLAEMDRDEETCIKAWQRFVKEWTNRDE
ncbi:MAG: fused MFS/spermidine synthase [Verrucomicrobiae bacterium]|nr:fused MFS/spermidine synthase [Verrucomicrobiae bacterium]NNJ43668.1 fused MFS/spermidine synthase [Akkermansiaceae bacterium]